MNTIPIGSGRFTLVSNDDYECLKRYKWRSCTTPSGKIYAINSRVGLMHRFILKTPKGLDGEHKDGDTLNNQRNNLRNATRGQNISNAKVNRLNLLGVKGVRKVGSKYGARITVNGKILYLGTYTTIAEASRAYEVASRNYFGEYPSRIFLSE